MQPDAAIEIRIGRLLEWQLDIASDGAATGFFCATVGCFHDPWPAAGHHREPEPRDPCAHLPRQLIMRIVRFYAGRAKDRHARADEMKRAKSAQKIAHDSQQRAELREPRARALEENFVRAFCRRDEVRVPRLSCCFRRHCLSHLLPNLRDVTFRATLVQKLSRRSVCLRQISG